MSPPQVSIEAKFAEFSQRDDKGIGFDWFLGNLTMNNQSIGMQGGTAPSFGGQPSVANPNGDFPSTFPRLTESGTDTWATSGLRSTTLPTVATMTGILTKPQFRVALKMIENRQGVDLLSAPTVTTISGRQARISVEETRTIIVGLGVQGLGQGGVQAAGVTP